MLEGIKYRNELVKANISSQIIVRKSHSTANILMNGENEILLLKRSPNDSFHPSTWCLAGGGVDAGETPMEGVKRETYEEAGIEESDYEILQYKKIDVKGNKSLHYFTSVVKQGIEPFVVVDEAEHCNYMWCSREDWMKMDLILDLKSHLMSIFNIKQ